MKPVVVISPMDCEFLYLAQKLSHKTEKHIGGYKFVEGDFEGYPIVFIRCLIGTINSAACALLAAEKYDPACIILQGTSGAHNPELEKYDIVIAKRVVGLLNCVSNHRDKGEGSNPMLWEDFGVQAYFKDSGKTDFVKSFDCDESLVNLISTVPYQFGRRVVGTVGAADIWNKEADIILHYHESKGTDCEAMEGFGVAQICAMYDIPMTEIRVISNSELIPGETFSKDTAICCQMFVWDAVKMLCEHYKSGNTQ